ncbi:MAG: hypothetical protein O3C20_07030 [Verrucomicrobia bacterium]|nr:hypothetical protein [Verrucomicrobiota bacterium]
MDQDTSTSPDNGSSNGSDKPACLTVFWQELKRRHVIRVAMVYAVVGWIVMQVASVTFEGFGEPLV